MATSNLILLLTSFSTLLLGLMVLLGNTARHQNRAFLGLTLTLSVWSIVVLLGVIENDRMAAERWIRLACYLSVLIPVAFQILCIAILSPTKSLSAILWSIRYHLLLNQAVGLLTFSRFFISEITMPGDPGFTKNLPIPVYGPGWHIMNAYILAALLYLIGSQAIRLRRTRGIKQAEMQFLLLGAALAVAMGSITQILIPLLTGSPYTQQYGPVALLLMNLTIAYGIATRRMLDIPTVMQRASAFVVLAAYLTGLYMAVYYSLMFFFGGRQEDIHHIIHFVAAIAVAFSMSPMHGFFQRVARNLFLTTQHRDIGRIVRVSRERFATISTMEEILAQLRDILAEGGLDPERLHLLLQEEKEFVEQVPQGESHRPLRLSHSSPLADYLRAHAAPIAADTMGRRRAPPDLQAALKELNAVGIMLAVGLFYKRELRGILLLARRESGRIYSSADQDALQTMCHQMATALENAQLYTDLQNSKRYSETILDSLLSGVIAVDRERRITTFNREAQRITGLDANALLKKPVEALPPVLAQAFAHVFETGAEQSDIEAVLEGPDDSEVPIRLGSTLFRGHQKQMMGAIVLFNDMTRVKALETLVRRSDRLASIGTLSAGMAHEIKNPLVTIKTFTQLLPERYSDEDFRLTFSDLISHEVDRIDSIVNQLLHFSRPSKPLLEPRSLHDLVHASLRLVHEQLRQHGIHLVTDIDADLDIIHADFDLLTQALINFILNAIQAMAGSGTLTIATRNTAPVWAEAPKAAREEAPSFIRLDIQDTGCGIADETLTHIFDPFFTTKPEGTGLGLSVAHGIIIDHNGTLDVDSEPGVGTVFHLYFPVQKEAAVAP